MTFFRKVKLWFFSNFLDSPYSNRSDWVCICGEWRWKRVHLSTTRRSSSHSRADSRRSLVWNWFNVWNISSLFYFLFFHVLKYRLENYEKRSGIYFSFLPGPLEQSISGGLGVASQKSLGNLNIGNFFIFKTFFTRFSFRLGSNFRKTVICADFCKLSTA